jgi:hypothetical protein
MSACKYYLKPKAVAAMAGACLIGLAPAAHADDTIYDKDGIKVDFGATVAAAAFAFNNANGGEGVTHRNETVKKNPQWAEGYVAPTLGLSLDRGAGSFFANGKLVAAKTIGDGDAAGNVQRDQGDASVDHLYAGWRSANLLPDLGENAIEVTVGAQPFVLGDGFLLGDGNFETDDEGAYWLAPRNGWRGSSAVVKLNTKPVRFDMFRLKSDADSGSDGILGLNGEYHWGKEDSNVVGLSFLRLNQSDISTRDGLNVLTARTQGNLVPQVPDLFLAGEYVREHNSNQDRKLNASAWYTEAAYTLSTLPWTPRIGYRYATFGGDDADTATSEAFDPLHYSLTRGWGTWYQGEITGQYVGAMANTNMTSQRIEVAVQPLESLTVTALYYLFDRNEVALGQDKKFGNELNLIADWAATEQLGVSAVIGWLDPHEGGRQVLGGSKDETLASLYVTYKY